MAIGQEELGYAIKLSAPKGGVEAAELAEVIAPMTGWEVEVLTAALRDGSCVVSEGLDYDEAHQMQGVFESLGANAEVVGAFEASLDSMSERPLFDGDDEVDGAWRTVISGSPGAQLEPPPMLPDLPPVSASAFEPIPPPSAPPPPAIDEDCEDTVVDTPGLFLPIPGVTVDVEAGVVPEPPPMQPLVSEPPPPAAPLPRPSVDKAPPLPTGTPPRRRGEVSRPTMQIMAAPAPSASGRRGFMVAAVVLIAGAVGAALWMNQTSTEGGSPEPTLTESTAASPARSEAIGKPVQEPAARPPVATPPKPGVGAAGSPDRARTPLEDGLTAAALMEKGQQACEQGLYAECERILKQVIRQVPDHKEAYDLLIQAVQKKEAAEKARP